MKLIVGLGNPGEAYENTRHNMGFMVVDRLSRELGIHAVSWKEEKKHRARVASVGDVLLVKPQTYVNASGACVKSLMDFYKLTPESIWVIHDEIDLPLGKIRIRVKGGSAGHNGVTSIINALKSDGFVRFRLGIGRGNLNNRTVVRFVLSKFRRTEAGQLRHLVKHGTEAVRLALFEGIDQAMNRFN